MNGAGRAEGIGRQRTIHGRGCREEREGGGYLRGERGDELWGAGRVNTPHIRHMRVPV